MVPKRVLQLLVLACLASALRAGGELYNHLVITPQSPVLEIGTNFTATCMIINTDEITAKDLYWNLSDITVSNKQYTKINSSSLSVTIPVIGEKHEWLFCFCKEVSNYVYLNRSKFRHGIILTKGYRPGKPENLSCEAVQVKMEISSTITCVWKKVGRSSTDVPTKYTLYVKEL